MVINVPEFCNGSVCLSLGELAKVDLSHDEDCLLCLFEIKNELDSSCKKILLSIEEFQCYISLESVEDSLLEHKISLFENGRRIYVCIKLEKIDLSKSFELGFCLGESISVKEEVRLV